MVNCASHLLPMFDMKTRDKCVRDTVRMMKQAQKDGTRFDAIAVCGISGLILGSPVAILLNKRLMVVRKEGDASNSRRSVEGGEYRYSVSDSTFKTKYLSHRVAILDDLIDHGDTVAHICERLTSGDPPHRIVGVFLYNPLSANREHPEWAWDGGGAVRVQRIPIFCLPEEPLKCYL